MKITGNEEIFKQLAARESGQTGRPVKGAFTSLLDQAARTDSGPAGETLPLQAPGSIKGVSFNPLLDVNSTAIPDRVENFLNLLDSYRGMLANPAISLKEIGPVMAKLMSEKSQLQQVLGALPAGDELRGILNELLVTASLEEVKFNKGDYNPV
ncbi:MAG: hypothetical protein GY697_09475 [Desulfobacterales bacterium]|nr:hypothetical protein [Desulfobacterales bacterium]